MDYAELNIDAAKASLATIRDLHAIGLASDADLVQAQKLAHGVLVEIAGEAIKRRTSALAVRRRGTSMRGIRAARKTGIGAAVGAREFVRDKAQSGRRSEVSVNSLFEAMAASL